MNEILRDYYLWILAFHVIAVICWMAGLLYLPRIFVYHTQVKKGSEADEKFKIMEKKLLRYIMNPAMIAAWVLGITLISVTDIGPPDSGMWIHWKLLLVLMLSATHGMMAKYRKDFERGRNKKSEKFFRFFNEAPTILMVLIVLLAVIKPF